LRNAILDQPAQIAALQKQAVGLHFFSFDQVIHDLLIWDQTTSWLEWAKRKGLCRDNDCYTPSCM